MKKVLIAVLLFYAAIYAQQQNELKDNSELYVKGGGGVTIGGFFIVNGTYPSLPNERVDQFVTRIFNAAKDKLFLRSGDDPGSVKEINNTLRKYSFRNIQLKRADGTSMNIDLMKFRINGDFKNNPYLRNDDILFFDPIDDETNFFTVSGLVNTPNRFPFVEGDRLNDAIELCGGFIKGYDIQEVQIFRLSADGNSSQIIKAGMDLNIPINRGDRIVVSGGENLRRDYSVKILGEVRTPGDYPVTKDKTTLKEVIDLAGGFKESASLKKAKVYSIFETDFKGYDPRRNYPELENQLMLRMSNTTIEDSSYLLLENRLRTFTEGGSVDFTKLNDPNSDAANYRLKDGDIIYVPIKRNTVYVFGQVPFPGQVAFIENKDYKYYIDRAGGPGEFAEEGIMIIKGGSHEWILATDPNAKVEEGDYIFVPKKVHKTFAQYAQEVGTYAGIIGSVATILLLIYQVTK